MLLKLSFMQFSCCLRGIFFFFFFFFTRMLLLGFKMLLWNILEIAVYKNPQCHMHYVHLQHDSKNPEATDPIE